MPAARVSKMSDKMETRGCLGGLDPGTPSVED
jgi:hypothetical protein